MAAAGMSPWRVLRALIILALLVSAFCSALAIVIVPTSLSAFREQVTRVRADVVSFVAQPGRFISLTPGLIFHVRERAANGVMHGIFINDGRDKEISTYVADRGQIVDSPAGTFLVLENGSIHRRSTGTAKSNSTSVVEFSRYALDLSSLAPSSKETAIRPTERPLAYLLHPAPDDFFQKFFPTRFREELHKRLAAGLYPLAYFAIAAAALARPRTTRQSRGMALVAIIPAMAAVQIGNFAIAGQLRSQAAAVPLMYIFPLLVVALCALILSDRIHFSTPRWAVGPLEALKQRLARGGAA